MRQREHRETQKHGIGVFRKLWKESRSLIGLYMCGPSHIPLPFVVTQRSLPCWQTAAPIPLDDPTTAKLPHKGSSSCHERGPRQTRLLVTACTHRCTRKHLTLRPSRCGDVLTHLCEAQPFVSQQKFLFAR